MSKTASRPLSGPATVGLNVTPIVQLVPAARDPPQVLLAILKSPTATMLEIVSGADTTGTGFYFLEMNTRLQVEHPVTEAITGLDLVEWQFRIAAGEQLPLTQEQVPLQGHAVEARIYAEDAYHGFLPTSGSVLAVRWPLGPGIRVDAGVDGGDVVGTRYDGLLAKLCVHGETRTRALARLWRKTVSASPSLEEAMTDLRRFFAVEQELMSAWTNAARSEAHIAMCRAKRLAESATVVLEHLLGPREQNERNPIMRVLFAAVDEDRKAAAADAEASLRRWRVEAGAVNRERVDRLSRVKVER